MTIKAKEILDGKFWILENQGVKVGTLSISDDKYILSDGTNTKFIDTKRQLEKDIGKVSWTKLEITEKLDKEMNGFPTSCVPFNPLYDVQRNLPLFTKSDKSKSHYCAGYYIIKFEKGWVKSFCPKSITLERYPYKGPFKTNIEMRTELSKANAKL